MAGKPNKIIRPGERDPEHIRADIERTRRRMARTIDEIQERFTPGHMKSVAKSVLRGQTFDRAGRMTQRVREARTTMYGFVRDNPLPAAMVGLGLSWLLSDMLMPEMKREIGMAGGEHAGRRSLPEGAGADISRQTETRARVGRRMMEGRYGTNPLALMAVSIAAGAALGLSNLGRPSSEADIEDTVRNLRETAKNKWEQLKQEFRETRENR